MSEGKMTMYLFVLGRDKDLSLLELECFFGGDAIKKVQHRFVVVDSEKSFTIEDFGGVTKFGRKISSLGEVMLAEDKITFSVRGDKKLFLQLKELFKEQRVKASHREFSYDPGNVDYGFVEFDGGLFLIQDVSKPKQYKQRDEARPRFDAKKVTSIRLAKMLINFSRAEKEILDPFCGNGTILQEGLLKGLQVIGMDRQIGDTRKNLAWLGRQRTLGKYRLIQGDATELREHIKKVECVVTEPYLGPYFKRRPSSSKAKRILRGLAGLYDSVLEQLSGVVEKRVVILIPRIQAQRKELGMDFLKIAEEHGFRVTHSEFVKLPLLYFLEGAKVKREIWVLERLKYASK